MLRESGSGQDLSEVSGRIISKKQMSLTAGNTSSLVVDSLRDRAVAWLYCDHASSDRHTVTAIIGAILRKLLTREALRDIQEADREGRELLLQDMMRILRTAIASLRQAFICIDALDECPPENLPELLESLRDIVQEFPRTRIFLTGRHHVQEVIRRHFAGMVAIPICPDPKDIRDYLRTRLEGDSKPEEMDNDLRADIGKIIVEKMSDRWVDAFGASPPLVVHRCILIRN